MWTHDKFRTLILFVIITSTTLFITLSSLFIFLHTPAHKNWKRSESIDRPQSGHDSNGALCVRLLRWNHYKDSINDASQSATQEICCLFDGSFAVFSSFFVFVTVVVTVDSNNTNQPSLGATNLHASSTATFDPTIPPPIDTMDPPVRANEGNNNNTTNPPPSSAMNLQDPSTTTIDPTI